MMQSTIDRHSHLLNPGPNATEQQYLEAAAEFTNACCWDEQQTYRMIRVDGGGGCYNPQGFVVCDKVCNLHGNQIYDLVTNSGTSHQQPGFHPTGSDTSPSQHVMPYDPYLSGPPMENTEGYPPYPGDQSFDIVGQALFDDYAEAGEAPNPGMSRWYGRCDYDFLTGVVPNMESAVNKHRPDWRKALGLPPKASSVG